MFCNILIMDAVQWFTCCQTSISWGICLSRKELMRDIAFRRFKESLFAHTLEPGQFVSQRELSELLDVPLAPIREAVHRLSSARLVKVIAQRGIQILEPSPQMLSEAFELRIILEVAAIKAVPLARIYDNLKNIEHKTKGLRTRLVEPLNFKSVKEVLDVDWALHELFISAMGNKTVEAVYQTNADLIRLARFSRRVNAEQLSMALNEHLEVIEAVFKQDCDSGAAKMKLHLKTALTRGLGISDV